MKITKFLGICVVLLAGGLLSTSAEAWLRNFWKFIPKKPTVAEKVFPNNVPHTGAGLRLGGNLLLQSCKDENSTYSLQECGPGGAENTPIVRTNPKRSGRGLWMPQERLKRRRGNSRSDIQLRPNRLLRPLKSPHK